MSQMRRQVVVVAGSDDMPGSPGDQISCEQAIYELVEAIRFTVEYVGMETLPPIEGWSWYDALCEYAPDVAEEFLARHEGRWKPPVIDQADQMPLA